MPQLATVVADRLFVALLPFAFALSAALRQQAKVHRHRGTCSLGTPDVGHLLLEDDRVQASLVHQEVLLKWTLFQLAKNYANTHRVRDFISRSFLIGKDLSLEEFHPGLHVCTEGPVEDSHQTRVPAIRVCTLGS